MAGQYALPGRPSLAGPAGAPRMPPSAVAAHQMLDQPVGVLVAKLAPQYANKVPPEMAKQTFREALKSSNFIVKSMVMSMMGPYLPKGVTPADIDKAVNEAPPPPEKPATPPPPPAAAAPPSVAATAPPPAPVAPAPAAATAVAPALKAAAAVPYAGVGGLYGPEYEASTTGATLPGPGTEALNAIKSPAAEAIAEAAPAAKANLGQRARSSSSSDVKGVSPALVAAINRVGANYGPYEVKITSGLRTGKGESFHGKGQALDVALIDRKTGEKLPNYQNAKNVAEYQNLAHAIYADAQKNDPALASRLRWGGYFGNDAGSGKPKYGSFDLMHFDEGGHVGMRGGSWKEGFSPEMQKYWKIPAMAAGGAPTGAAPGTPQPDVQAGAGPAAVAAARTADAAPSQAARGPGDVRKAFLDTIAKGESDGTYDYIIGGARAKDLSQHPRQRGSAGKYGSSDAAGRYQFLSSTWDEQAKKYGYKDFSEKSQDDAAWNYAKDVYKTKAGRDLETDLKSNDPKVLNNISSTLGQTWTSLPGGTQPNDNWKGKDFASVYNENLKGSGTEYPDPTPGVGAGEDYYRAQTADPVVASSGSGGIGSDSAASASVAAPDTASAGSGFNMGGVGDALEGIAKAFGGGAGARALPSTPANATAPQVNMPTGPVPIVDPRTADAQRQMLAMAMQRLNSGKLF